MIRWLLDKGRDLDAFASGLSGRTWCAGQKRSALALVMLVILEMGEEKGWRSAGLDSICGSYVETQSSSTENLGRVEGNIYEAKSMRGQHSHHIPTIGKRASRVDVIVFDLGGVLLDWDPREVYRRMSDDEEKIQRFLKEVAVSSWNQRMDAGESFAQAVADRVRSFPEWKEWIEAWQFEWPTMLKGVKPDVLEVFQQLRKLRQLGQLKGIYALSNWSSETFPIATSRFPFLAEFDGKLISGHEKMVKPQPEFYLRLCDRYALRPEQCLFIDDLSSNIEVARDLGFATHWFRDSENLIQELNGMGLPISRASSRRDQGVIKG